MSSSDGNNNIHIGGGKNKVVVDFTTLPTRTVNLQQQYFPQQQYPPQPQQYHPQTQYPPQQQFPTQQQHIHQGMAGTFPPSLQNTQGYYMQPHVPSHPATAMAVPQYGPPIMASPMGVMGPSQHHNGPGFSQPVARGSPAGVKGAYRQLAPSPAAAKVGNHPAPSQKKTQKRPAQLPGSMRILDLRRSSMQAQPVPAQNPGVQGIMQPEASPRMGHSQHQGNARKMSEKSGAASPRPQLPSQATSQHSKTNKIPHQKRNSEEGLKDHKRKKSVQKATPPRPAPAQQGSAPSVSTEIQQAAVDRAFERRKIDVFVAPAIQGTPVAEKPPQSKVHQEQQEEAEIEDVLPLTHPQLHPSSGPFTTAQLEEWNLQYRQTICALLVIPLFHANDFSLDTLRIYARAFSYTGALIPWHFPANSVHRQAGAYGVGTWVYNDADVFLCHISALEPQFRELARVRGDVDQQGGVMRRGCVEISDGESGEGASTTAFIFAEWVEELAALGEAPNPFGLFQRDV